jgi:excisionase family DNA binding protein
MNSTKYWNYKEVSKQTGMPTGTVYALVSQRRIPHIRLGKRHVLFPVEDVLLWIEKHRVQEANK